MAHQSFLRNFVFVVLTLLVTDAIGADKAAKSAATHSTGKTTIVLPDRGVRPELPERSAAAIPDSKTKGSVEKNEKSNAEELAHIHHFHKERVKKIKRHHKKFWVLSKLVLILCHVALLVLGFLHILH